MLHNQVYPVGNTEDRKIDYCSFKWSEEGRSPRTTVEDFGEVTLKLKWKGKLADVRNRGQAIGFSLLIKGDNISDLLFCGIRKYPWTNGELLVVHNWEPMEAENLLCTCHLLAFIIFKKSDAD